MKRWITAFGASASPRCHPEYDSVVELGKLLAQNGWNAQLGGHVGMMAAFAKGIHTGGGRVRGITLERFPTPPANHLHEEVRAKDFFQRMQRLIEECDAYVVLPGGLGTLAELAMAWDLLAIRVLDRRPLILYGWMWPPILQVLKRHLILSSADAFEFIHCCKRPREVLLKLM